MDEPYRSLQDIGEATETLAVQTDPPPEFRFSRAQTLLSKIQEIKSSHHDLPTGWLQYLASVEVSLHQIQAEARRHLPRHTASQISLHVQSNQNKPRHEEQYLLRSLRSEHRQRRKLIATTSAAIALILIVASAIGLYQWDVVSSDEAWFHDAGLRRWSILENRIRLGKSIDTRNHNGKTIFLIFAEKGTREDLVKIKSLGANIHATDIEGRSALHYAAAAGQPDSVQWLLSQGININIPDKSGTTPLHYFFKKAMGTPQSLATCRLLLERGANVNVSNDEESLFMAAILWVRGAYFEKSTAILQSLLDRGADVNYIGANGNTAIKNALAKYLPETPSPKVLISTDPVVKLLVNSGATYHEDNLILSGSPTSPQSEKLKFFPSLK